MPARGAAHPQIPAHVSGVAAGRVLALGKGLSVAGISKPELRLESSTIPRKTYAVLEQLPGTETCLLLSLQL